MPTCTQTLQASSLSASARRFRLAAEQMQNQAGEPSTVVTREWLVRVEGEREFGEGWHASTVCDRDTPPAV